MLHNKFNCRWWFCLPLLFLSAFSLGKTADKEIALSPMFSDNMVIQRNKNLTLWGTGTAGKTVSITFNNQSQKTEVGAKGTWSAQLEAMPAGGPYDLSINGKVQVKNIAIGDVWLCSGQSNMAWQVSKSTSRKPWDGKPPAHIRFLKIKRDSTTTKLSTLKQEASWEMSSSKALEDFSSVCALFAENLDQNNKTVPMGLIDSSWGGSQIEAWMSQESLAKVEGFENDLSLLHKYVNNQREANSLFHAQWQQWWQSKSSDKPWVKPHNAQWPRVPKFVDWKTFGDKAIENHDGMLWFSTNFKLDKTLAKKGAKINLGGIDEVDMTWINGKFIGSQFGWGTNRNYEIPQGVLKPGDNTLTVNVVSTWGSGGMVGPADKIQLQFADGSSQNLSGSWGYKPVDTSYGYPPNAPWNSINGLTGLFNAMIAPLEGFKLAGTLWYQGESNTGRGKMYAPLLKSMMNDWRARFGEDMPFLAVQLPNFGTAPTAPAESGWAEVRYSQWQAVKGNPLNALVVSIDAGDPNDLHPTDKSLIAQRASDIALAYQSGKTKQVLIHGAYPKKAYKKKKNYVVAFPKELKTLENKSNKEVNNVELCNDTCIAAKATLKKGKIIIAAEQLQDAKKIRYCWADAPVCSLYSKSGIPVSSFEIAIN